MRYLTCVPGTVSQALSKYKHHFWCPQGRHLLTAIVNLAARGGICFITSRMRRIGTDDHGSICVNPWHPSHPCSLIQYSARAGRKTSGPVCADAGRHQ